MLKLIFYSQSLVTIWAWVWYGTHDFLYLVDGRCPREQGFSQQHLSQDAAKAPHVHTLSVPLDKMYSFHNLVHSYLLILQYCFITVPCMKMWDFLHDCWINYNERTQAADIDNRCTSQLIPCGSQQDLRSSVPPCRHILCQRWIPAVLLDLVEWSGQAKITQLDNTVSVQEHVGWLWEMQIRETILHKDNDCLIFMLLTQGQTEQVICQAPSLTTVWKQILYKWK